MNLCGAILPITGIDLPDRTICLTFDDGPGVGFDENANACSSTVRLAEYLADQHVPGTFFVVGKYVDRFPGVIDRISKLGHLVANHTYDHVSLPEFTSIGGSAAVQVAKTTTQLMGSARRLSPDLFPGAIRGMVEGRCEAAQSGFSAFVEPYWPHWMGYFT